jgi:hypothetical protein
LQLSKPGGVKLNEWSDGKGNSYSSEESREHKTEMGIHSKRSMNNKMIEGRYNEQKKEPK